MAPVRVAVVFPTGTQIDLIIPLTGETTFKTLQRSAIERAAHHHSMEFSQIANTLLRLGNRDGPFLHPDDKVGDVISAGDTVFVILIASSTAEDTSANLPGEPSINHLPSTNSFQLRVITPHLAHCHEDIRTIPLLENGKVFPSDLTLRDLRASIAKSLDIILAADESTPQECNCRMAEMIYDAAYPSVNDNLKVLVVSGFSKITWIDIEIPTHGAIMAALREHLGELFDETKSVHLKGNSQAEDDHFARLPVVSICAKSRHADILQLPAESSASTSALDLHTAEGPIQTCCHDFSMERLGLTHLVVNDILSIYAIERKTDTAARQTQTLGKDAMFSAAKHWELPKTTPSTRGMNAFLSSLRVFANQINAKVMDERRQNTLLKLIHQMTRYLPALRAARILMDGKTLRPYECAAIVQPFAEALRNLIPSNLIENDQRRYLEGARLLFGFILQKVEALSTKALGPRAEVIEDDIPYLKLFRTIDLRDVSTNECIIDPVPTNLGLMEWGSFDALKTLHNCSEDDSIFLCVHPDQQALRVALHSGGMAAESSYYDTDALKASLSRNPGNNDLERELQSLSKELSYLEIQCHSTGMSVTHPTSLQAASAPVLTLDRDAYLCVYVGRAACAPPDRDVSVFRPVAATEEVIDASVVAHLIEPIIAAREVDGTLVFDLVGDTSSRKYAKPTELIMFCVDCSQSMDGLSDFQEIHETPVTSMVSEAAVNDLPVTEEVDAPINLDGMKDWLAAHESFDDMVAIITSARRQGKRAVAQKVLEFVSLLTSRELVDNVKDLVTMRSWADRNNTLEVAAPLDLQVSSLRRLLGGLNIYKSALCDFLMFKAQSLTEVEEFIWTYGTPIPRSETASSVAQVLQVADDLSVPPEIVCPISHAVFEDPVTTSDNFTYERRSIERWFQIRPSSPSTGLPLGDLSLRRHQLLYDQSKQWISGIDILQAASPAPERRVTALSRPAADLDLNFVTPAGTFSRRVPSTLALTDLYRLAYRGMRGTQRYFSLHYNGSLLEWSNAALGSRRITSKSNIVANFYPAVDHEALLPGDEPESMCLVKAYRLHSELFSYWVPRYTCHSVASILFRYWRFRMSSSRDFSSVDEVVWSGLRNRGDGFAIGEKHDHWDRLANLFSKLRPRDLLQTEELLADLLIEEPDESDTVLPGTVPARYRVLKVNLDLYESA